MTLWNGRRAPMTLLGGYLGAGKTTIVNHVLGAASGRRVAVLVNDVGAVAVDADLIASRHDDTIELTNGCICCSLVDGFAVALETLRERPEAPDHVLVELSGVAEPGRVLPWASTAGFRPDGVVVAADADQIALRAADPRLADLVRAQLRAADLVLVTKTDLVDDRGPVDALLDRCSTAPRLDVVDGAVSTDLLLGPLAVRGQHDPSVPHLADHAVAVVEPVRTDVDHLTEAVRALPDDVVRAKGVVDTLDGPRLVQRVGRRVRVDVVEDGTTGPLVLVGLSEEALRVAAERLGS